jgi:hypothetical protein
MVDPLIRLALEVINQAVKDIETGKNAVEAQAWLTETGAAWLDLLGIEPEWFGKWLEKAGYGTKKRIDAQAAPGD